MSIVSIGSLQRDSSVHDHAVPLSQNTWNHTSARYTVFSASSGFRDLRPLLDPSGVCLVTDLGDPKEYSDKQISVAREWAEAVLWNLQSSSASFRGDIVVLEGIHQQGHVGNPARELPNLPQTGITVHKWSIDDDAHSAEQFLSWTERIDLFLIMAVSADRIRRLVTLIDDAKGTSPRTAIVMAGSACLQSDDGKVIDFTLSLPPLYRTRVLGPDSSGVILPHVGLNASYVRTGRAESGSVGGLAFVVQSRGIGAAVVEWCRMAQNISLGMFIDLGEGSSQRSDQVDNYEPAHQSDSADCEALSIRYINDDEPTIEWDNIVTTLGDDRHCNAIFLCVDSIANARSFLSALREVSLTKPVVVFRGQSQPQNNTFEDAVFNAALRRCGALRVRTLAELFHLTVALGTSVPTVGGHGCLQVVSNVRVPLTRHTSQRATMTSLPANANRSAFVDATLAALRSTDNDGVLVVYAPLAGPRDSMLLAESLGTLCTLSNRRHGSGQDNGGECLASKALLFCVLGVREEETRRLADACLGIPVFRRPDDAERTFELLYNRHQNLQLLYETPLSIRQDGGVAAENDVNAPEEEAVVHEQKACLEEKAIACCKDTTAAAFVAKLSDRRRTRLQSQSSDGIASTMESRQIQSQPHTHRQTIRSPLIPLLSEVESKQLLQAYGIPTVQTMGPCQTADDAVAAARQVGYPVVLKLQSRLLAHKSAIGGVQLNLVNEDEVRSAFARIRSAVDVWIKDSSSASVNLFSAEEAEISAAFQGVSVQRHLPLDRGFEVQIGMHVDPHFGPIVTFGLGGRALELNPSSGGGGGTGQTVGLPPLNGTLAKRMLEASTVYEGLRWSPRLMATPTHMSSSPIPEAEHGNIKALRSLERLLVDWSVLVAQQRRIMEATLNPVLVTATECVVLDATVRLFPPFIPYASLPRPAIRPYPLQYIRRGWHARNRRDSHHSEVAISDSSHSGNNSNGTPPGANINLTFRPIKPEDEPAVRDFHASLSRQSVYLRYFGFVNLEARIAHERLARLCFIDYDREMALIVHVDNIPDTVVAMGRLSRPHLGHGPTTADIPGSAVEGEISLIVSDEWHGHGIGKELVTQLEYIAALEGVSIATMEIMRENTPMQSLAEKLGYTLHFGGEHIRAHKMLSPSGNEEMSAAEIAEIASESADAVPDLGSEPNTTATMEKTRPPLLRGSSILHAQTLQDINSMMEDLW
eukprot:Clim_evm6s139 gene=Clim_evmTU6s139